jgi:hypothetical protein
MREALANLIEFSRLSRREVDQRLVGGFRDQAQGCMTPLNPEFGGTAGKGPVEIVACRAFWRVVFCDGLMQLASGRATRPLAPPRG